MSDYEEKLSAFFRRHRYINEAVVRGHIKSGDGTALRIYLSNHGIADDPPMATKAAPAQKPAQPPALSPMERLARSSWRHGLSADGREELARSFAAIERRNDILALPEAAGREALARHIAFRSPLSVPEAIDMLRSAPAGIAGAPKPALPSHSSDSTAAAVPVRPDQAAHPSTTPADDIWRRAIARANGG